MKEVKQSARNGCDSDCRTCKKSEGCTIRKESLNEYSRIKNVIGIISGKGGVGKSTVTSMLGIKLAKLGYRVGIMDADITGPSIPHMFGLNGPIRTEGSYMVPAESEEGIKVISINLLIKDKETPVLYRGPVISTFVKQFWHDVIWGELDYLLIDMPPGTGDVPLTVYQSIPVDGIIMVSSPQNLVKMIVMKAANMAVSMNIPILGIVENYSYFVCPECGTRHDIFGVSAIDEIAMELGTRVIARIPIIPEIAEKADTGNIYDGADIDISVMLDKEK